MSALEIVLLVLMVIGLGLYLGISIYDLKHPEKKKARKERKLAKKQKKEEQQENDNEY